MTDARSQPNIAPLRFNVIWHAGSYGVSIPGYEGGEVVDAASFDALRAKVDELTAALRDAQSYLRTTSPNSSANVLAKITRALAVNSQDRGS